MSKPVDGGPAFPRPHSEWTPDDHTVYHEAQCGLTLRDYFAAKAMQSIVAANFGAGRAVQKADEGSLEFVSEQAYDIADSMILQRDL